MNRVALAMVLLLTCLWGNAHAVEGGRSLYLLGKRGPLAGLIPKAGWYISNDMYYYNGDTDQKLPIAGVTGQNVSADALANIFQITRITETSLPGDARLAVGMVIPCIHSEVAANASALYNGTPLDTSISDDITSFGDLAMTASLGWHKRDGDLFRALNVYSALTIPTGSYAEGRLANAGANRWGLDIGTGFTLGNFKRGREFSGVLGMTINGENLDTDYKSGVEAHIELAYKQHLASGLSAGLVGYYNYQLTADSGGSAVLGDFKGRVAAIGPELSCKFEFADRSMGLGLRWYHEFDAKNRVQGDSVFLTLSLPLYKKSVSTQ